MSHLDAAELGGGIGMVNTKSYYNAGGSFEDSEPESAELPCDSPKDEAWVAGMVSGSFEETARCYFPLGFGSVTCTAGEAIEENS